MTLTFLVYAYIVKSYLFVMAVKQKSIGQKPGPFLFDHSKTCKLYLTSHSGKVFSRFHEKSCLKFIMNSLIIITGLAGHLLDLLPATAECPLRRRWVLEIDL